MHLYFFPSYLCLCRGYLYTILLPFFFLLVRRAPWPVWPLTFQVYQFSGVVPMNVTEKHPLRLKIDRFKDGCHLKHIFGVGRSVCLSVYLSVCLSLSLNCVCVYCDHS